MAQIATEIVSSKSAVRKGLRDFGIPIREPNKHHGHPSQTRYGNRIYKGREVVHQIEYRVIETINEMRAQGLSLRTIAKALTQLQVPTKCKGKAWHPEMINRILNNNQAKGGFNV
ncbi:recombinase family protein [Bdellovibrio bacteriovorus]|uniref:recombinase family protein n=1 Tax=Bdellovibrio bacteriovorus TaxID=959 RepID=UPI0035A5A6C5